jgi:tRNA threonylcarbamoyladenosine biosynthesis protein TsaB
MASDAAPAAAPLVLAIESATPAGSVSLVSPAGSLGEIRLAAGSKMSESFLPAVDALLNPPASAPRVPTHVAVSAGPGSFTGLRVGMAAAKGLCFGWGVPMVPVPTLQALAWRFRRGEGDVVCPIQDARKGELYSALFRIEGGAPVRITPDRAIAPEALAGILPDGPVLFCGDGVSPFRAFLADRFGARALFPPEGDELPQASAVGGVALDMLAAGDPLPDPATAVPTYVRLSEAEVRLEVAGRIIAGDTD